MTQPKKKTGLSHKIVETLRWRIVRWEYPPNYPLSEEMLCQEFGVSRSPVREALKTLEAGGLIQRQKNRTHVVKQIRTTDIEELYDFRLALELYSLDILVSSKVLHGRVQDLRNTWHKMNLANLDNKGLAIADQDFHEGLLDIVGNKTFLDAVHKLNERLFIFRMMDFDQPLRPESTREQHLAILDAILSGDIQDARSKLSANILEGRNNVNRAFAEIVANAYDRAELSH